jgi:ABC-type dipeptide/oligopeptide/nickel transport system permease subunit
MAGASRWRSASGGDADRGHVGVIIGAIAGMSRGWVDAALMWLTDLFLSLPQLPLLLLIIYLFREPLKACSAWRWASSS